mmetsp:Transcript_23107/g.56150  ORF Transcript_23107/g.56150 Transcript_23107/m.56150 type:complete len:161 (+) Transcript_23107:115-597(+)
MAANDEFRGAHESADLEAPGAPLGAASPSGPQRQRKSRRGRRAPPAAAEVLEIEASVGDSIEDVPDSAVPTTIGIEQVEDEEDGESSTAAVPAIASATIQSRSCLSRCCFSCRRRCRPKVKVWYHHGLQKWVEQEPSPWLWCFFSRSRNGHGYDPVPTRH